MMLIYYKFHHVLHHIIYAAHWYSSMTVDSSVTQTAAIPAQNSAPKAKLFRYPGYVMTIVQIVFVFFLILPVLDVSAIEIPSWKLMPGRDMGVFMYSGWRILEGDIPYIDIWDHKPPLLLYVHAAAVALGDWWGVFIMQVGMVYVAAVMSYWLLKRAFGFLPAIIATLLWIYISAPANQLKAEELALPFQFGAMLLFVFCEKRGRYGWYGVLLGILGGCAFLFKQNFIGIWVAIGLYTLLKSLVNRSWGGFADTWGSIISGAAIPVLISVIYFAAYGALDEYWDVAFVYNFAYSSVPVEGRLATMLGVLQFGFEQLGLSLRLIGVIWGIALIRLWQTLKRRSVPTSPLVYFLILALPIEFFFISVSGEEFIYYFTTLMPVVGLAIAFFAYQLIVSTQAILASLYESDILPLQVQPLTQWGIQWIKRLWYRFVPVAIILMMISGTLRFISVMNNPVGVRNDNRVPTVNYLLENSSADDIVLLWGAEARVNFLAKRKAPGRFVYQYPLYRDGYQNAELIDEFLNDLHTETPLLIIDTSEGNDRIPPLDAEQRVGWQPSQDYSTLPEMQRIYDFIDENYTLVDWINGEWSIYRYTGRIQ